MKENVLKIETSATNRNPVHIVVSDSAVFVRWRTPGGILLRTFPNLATAAGFVSRFSTDSIPVFVNGDRIDWFGPPILVP